MAEFRRHGLREESRMITQQIRGKISQIQSYKIHREERYFFTGYLHSPYCSL